MNPKFFPTVLIILMCAAGVVYGCQANWRMMIYWFAGATITTTVTY